MFSAVLETRAAVLATLDRIALLLADMPTPMESTSEEASEEAKDQSKHDREHYRRHNREIDADISARTLVLDIARYKRKPRRNIWPETTDEGMSE